MLTPEICIAQWAIQNIRAVGGPEVRSEGVGVAKDRGEGRLGRGRTVGVAKRVFIYKFVVANHRYMCIVL